MLSMVHRVLLINFIINPIIDNPIIFQWRLQKKVASGDVMFIIFARWCVYLPGVEASRWRFRPWFWWRNSTTSLLHFIKRWVFSRVHFDRAPRARSRFLNRVIRPRPLEIPRPVKLVTHNNFARFLLQLFKVLHVLMRTWPDHWITSNECVIFVFSEPTIPRKSASHLLLNIWGVSFRKQLFSHISHFKIVFLRSRSQLRALRQFEIRWSTHLISILFL
jgi:hypothetical protein